MKNINESQIVSKWSPMIKQTTGINEESKVNWMAKYAHYHALNEAVNLGGVSSPYSTIYNVPGVGNAQPAQSAPMTANGQMSPAAKGSGDKWPALLPMSLQVAARTIGFDLVNVVPMPGPTGVISYMDYVYAGGKQPYGAPPAYNTTTANPASQLKNMESAPVFKIAVNDTLKTALKTLSAGAAVNFVGQGGAQVNTKFIAFGRIDGLPQFRINNFVGTTGNLSDVFAGGAITIAGDVSTGTVVGTPSLVSTLQDQIQGFAGSGENDLQPWTGSFVDGKVLYEPLSRGTGEMAYPKALGLQVFTKFVQVGTYQVSVSVTQEQIQDLNKQWGIDVIAMVENAGINEISQSINKHITSRLFAMGWLNHTRAYDAESINLNLDVTANTPSTTPTFAVPNEAGTDVAPTLVSMVLPGYKQYAGGTFENQDTIIKRIMAHITQAGNVIMQRGRRGPANAIVANIKIAGALMSAANYSFAPITNTFSQNNGSLYPLGTIAGMTLYTDPNMSYEDTRVLVLRKGAADEPGVVFCPYLMAESVKLITEGTGAPKVIIKSRYALVDAGWHPETQYLTLYFKTNVGGII